MSEQPDCTWRETIDSWRDGNASIKDLGEAFSQAQKENEVKGQ